MFICRTLTSGTVSNKSISFILLLSKLYLLFYNYTPKLQVYYTLHSFWKGPFLDDKQADEKSSILHKLVFF